MSRPTVSVITPTYNRRDFLPYLLHQFSYQTYPKEKMELIVLDDSSESNEDLFPKNDPRIRYIHLKEKVPLGKKRNMLNQLAKHDIIVCMDDDDFYSQERVSHAVHKLMSNPKIEIGGSTILHVYYPHIDKIVQMGPYNNNHSTAGPMCYKRSYLKNHSYPEDAHKAEESQFTNSFTEPLIQLDPYKTMLCIAHNNNTVDKKPFITSGKLIPIKIKKFFQHGDKKMLERINSIREGMLKSNNSEPNK
jgi:glycosyltransferase involved in cell wall biosynthesis